MIWYKMNNKDVLTSLKADIKNGLSTNEAKDRINKYGKNVIEKSKRKSLLKRFVEQLSDYMIIILLIAAVVSFGVSYFEGNPDITEPLIILSIVILNAIIGIVQESKAEKAIEALNKMTAPKTKVLRDGNLTVIDTINVTIGDILVLKSGDSVPADARIIEANSLSTDESALTGESMPVQKTSTRINEEEISVSDMNNMLWSSTMILSGSCKAVVTDIGMDTQTGMIAKMINNKEAPKTPLQEKLSQTGKLLGLASVLICIIIFIVGVINKVNIIEMFMTSVSLAVAAIPEGLPAIVTVMLAMGVRKMACKNAIVRRLPAVETLGCANVICSDKTGTLTKNIMTVEKIINKSGDLLQCALMCCNNSDPTEQAIVKTGYNNGISYDDLTEKYKRVKEIPFNSNDKYMITLNKFNGSFLQIIKGAPDVIIKMCKMTFEEKRTVIKEIEEMAKSGLRVIAVGKAESKSEAVSKKVNYTLCGLIGISDPLRDEVKNSVKVCKIAGIKPVMITGDHKDTATAIAKKAGILTDEKGVMTGAMLDKLSDDELAGTIKEVSVFARVTPTHKVRIVEAFQKNGMVTAMTGDGVNDAPALKKADIGCAMGQGTDVAKGASDIILTDNNFNTIVEAIKQGRVIFSNIKKTVHFLLSSNMGEIFTIFTAILLRLPSPLTAVQLLWVNLITDSLPAIALGMENNEKEAMSQKPVNRKKSLFSDGMVFNIVLEGLMISALSLIAYIFSLKVYKDLTVARTLAFCVLALSQLIHSFNMHSEKPIIKGGICTNKLLYFSLFLGCVLQYLLVTVKPMADMFGMAVLNLAQIKLILALSVVPIVVIECVKLIDTVFKK